MMADFWLDKHITLTAALVVKNPLSGSDRPGHYTLGFSPYSSYTLDRPYICVSNKEKLFLYQIKDITSIADPSIPKNLPVNMGSYDMAIGDSDYVHFNFLDNMDEDNLIMSYISDDWYDVFVFVFPLNRDGIPLDLRNGASRSSAQSLSLGYGGSVDMKTLYMCSASGRVFLYSKSSLSTIQVFDYL